MLEAIRSTKKKTISVAYAHDMDVLQAIKEAHKKEIAQAIYFLADDDQSSFMTGQALIVDGGATARLSTE